jgi:outer membrane lipoprotein carrier protein
MKNYKTYNKFKSTTLLCEAFFLIYYFMKKLLCFLTLIYLLFFSCSALSASSIDEELQKIQKAYENIKDIRGNFVQRSYIRDLKRTDTFNGQFFIKIPKKLRWEYKGERPQEVFINNNEILIHQKKERQAFKGRFDWSTYGQAPIALLNGFGKIQEQFSVSENKGNLLLKPRQPMSGILSVEVVLSEKEFPIGSFIIKDSHSNKIEMILKDIKINTGIEEKLFDPSLPNGIKIYEYNPGD